MRPDRTRWPRWRQTPGESRLFDKRHWVASNITNEALLRTRHIAGELAETRGWNDRIVVETNRALAVVLAAHQTGDLIAWSQLTPALRSRDLSVTRTAEILGLAGLLNDDRVSSFDALKQSRLAVLPPPMAADVEHWLRIRSQGGPRSLPRDEHTVRMNLNRVHPLLLIWAQRYVHLREVTAADVTTATEALTGSLRNQTFTALRSLFRHCKKTGRIFNDPTRGINIGRRPLHLIQPLLPQEIDQATAAALTPAARLALALAAVHAARPKTIRELHLDDLDLGNRRLTLAGKTRPLDDLTRTPPAGLAAAPRPPMARHRQPAPDRQPADRHDHPSGQRELADRELPRTHRHPRAPTSRPPTRGSPHPRPRPPAPRRRVRHRRHHRYPLRHRRTTAPADPRRATQRRRFP